MLWIVTTFLTDTSSLQIFLQGCFTNQQFLLPFHWQGWVLLSNFCLCSLKIKQYNRINPPYLLNSALSAVSESYGRFLNIPLFCFCFLDIVRSVLTEFLLNISVKGHKIFLLEEHAFLLSNAGYYSPHLRTYHTPKSHNNL